MANGITQIIKSTSIPLEKRVEKLNHIFKSVSPSSGVIFSDDTMLHLKSSLLTLEGIPVDDDDVLLALSLLWKAISKQIRKEDGKR